MCVPPGRRKLSLMKVARELRNIDVTISRWNGRTTKK
jgi:hypothetical protein